jgi:hypothetical protein
MQPVWFAQNLFTFLTWASLPIFLAGSVGEGKKRIEQSYRDGKHAPLWHDWLSYGAIILICAAAGHYAKATVWAFCLSIDLNHREASKKG